MVRSVTSDAISIEEMNYGKIIGPKAVTTNFNRITTATLKLNALDRRSLLFKGYILHEKNTVSSPPTNSNTYTVVIAVNPVISGRRHASVTFYGAKGYYQHVAVDGNAVRLAGVPGGPGVKCRIDVDFANGQHHSYYDQEINGRSKTVNFSYSDATKEPSKTSPSAQDAARIAEQKRQAELKQQADLKREAEQKRQAELKQQADQKRQDEQKKREEEQKKRDAKKKP